MLRQRSLLDSLQQGMAHALSRNLQGRQNALSLLQHNLPRAKQQALQRLNEACSRAELRLSALDPARVLQRGYAWLTHEDGRPITGVGQVHAGQKLQATLADGTVDLRVQNTHRN